MSDIKRYDSPVKLATFEDGYSTTKTIAKSASGRLCRPSGHDVGWRRWSR